MRSKRAGTGKTTASKKVRTTKQKTAKKVSSKKVERIVISPPNLARAIFRINGGSVPYVGNAFSRRQWVLIKEKQEDPTAGSKRKKHDARDFRADWESAKHISEEGWCGMPASGFRNAMISACRISGFQMTKARLSVFCVADGLDHIDGTGLVKIQGCEPEYVEHIVRVGPQRVADIRPRPMWKGWFADVTLQWDADQFTITDITNLLWRAGAQVGIGEGRNDSRTSNGMGWGSFSVDLDVAEVAA